MTKAGLAKYLESMARSLLISTAVILILFVGVPKLGIIVAMVAATVGAFVMAHFTYRERLAWDVCSTCNEIHAVGDHHEDDVALTDVQASRYAAASRRMFSVVVPVPYFGVHGAVGCTNCGWNRLLLCGKACYEHHAYPKPMADMSVAAFEAHRCEDHIPVLSTDPEDRLGVG